MKIVNFNEFKSEIIKNVETHYEQLLEELLNKYINFKKENLDFFKYKKKQIKRKKYLDIEIEIEFSTSIMNFNDKDFKEGNIINIIVKKDNTLLNIYSTLKEIYFESSEMHYSYSPLLDYWNINIKIEDDFYNRATLINNNGFYQIHLVKENSDGSAYKCIMTENDIFDLEYFIHKKETIGIIVKDIYFDRKIPKLRVT